MGDVVTGRPYTEGEGLPPVSEHLKPDGHCQFRGLDMSEIDSGEQLRQVTLSGAGELCLVTHPRIEVARGPPERGEGTAVPGEIPYLSLIHISEPTRLGMISYAVFCLKKKK